MSFQRRYNTSFKIWLEYKGKPLLGEGGAEILRCIHRYGSISRAAEELGMSYRYVWGYVKNIEKVLGGSVLETFKGGKTGGGGARLTELGTSILDEYDRLKNHFDKVSPKAEVSKTSGSKSGTRIGSIIIDCNKFDKMLIFWQGALHYVPRKPAKDGWVVLRDLEGRNPNVSLNQVSEKCSGRNRLHLDLYTDNREREVKRLLKIGAKRHRQTYGPDDDFRVLEDPDGNLFCVVQKDRAATGSQGPRK